jgi:hypothetical protein
MVAIKFALVAALSAAPAVFAYEKYLATLPNGAAMGKKLGHTADAYTPFGDLYKSKGGAWATLCKEKYPGSSVSVGAALGDPCCKWTSGAAQVTLSAPDTAAKECAAASPAPAASSAAPAAAPGPAPAVPAPAPTPAPAGPGKVLPATIPSPAPASGNGTKPAVPGPAPAPTPASSGKGTGKATGPTKICT